MAVNFTKPRATHLHVANMKPSAYGCDVDEIERAITLETGGTYRGLQQCGLQTNAPTKDFLATLTKKQSLISLQRFAVRGPNSKNNVASASTIKQRGFDFL